MVIFEGKRASILGSLNLIIDKISGDESGQKNWKKCQNARFGGPKKPSVLGKLEKMAKISHFLWFSSNFLVFAPNYQLKSASLSKIKFTLVYRPFPPLDNDKKCEILAMFSILPNTDGFFGSIFYILGRFSKLPPPLPLKNLFKKFKKNKKTDFKWRIRSKIWKKCQNGPIWSTQKSHQFRVIWKKCPKFPIFVIFEGKRAGILL